MKMDNPTTINAIGGILAAIIILIFTIWSGRLQKTQSDLDKTDLLNETKKVGKLNEDLKIKSEEYAKAQDEKATEIIQLNIDAKIKAEEQARINAANATKQQEYADKIIALQGEVGSKADSLIQAGIENKNLYKELYATQKELYNYQTGGDSYCYLTFHVDSESGSVRIQLNQVGKYPISGLGIDISNASHMDTKSYISPAKHLFYNYIEKIGVNYRQELCTLNLGDYQPIKYWVINFETKDGIKKWHQRVVFTPLLDDRAVELNIRDHTINYQVYTLTENDMSSNNTQSNDPVKVFGVAGDIMHIVRECQSAGPQHNIDWTKYPHAYIQKKGTTERSVYNTNIKETIYLPNAKDCGGYK